MTNVTNRPPAIVADALSAIGLEPARCCLKNKLAEPGLAR